MSRTTGYDQDALCCDVSRLRSSFLLEEKDLIEGIYSFSTKYSRNPFSRAFLPVLKFFAPNTFGAIIGRHYTTQLDSLISDDNTRLELFNLPVLSRGNSKIVNNIIKGQYSALANKEEKNLDWHALSLASQHKRKAALTGLGHNALKELLLREEIKPEIKRMAMSILAGHKL